jgi:hypothetical protein
MSRLISSNLLALALLAGIAGQSASAADEAPCSGFKWDVSRELVVMKQTPQDITAAGKPGPQVPELKIGKLYAVKLADQGAVIFMANPAISKSTEGARAGLVRFRSEKAGRYRVSITSGHWIDIVDAGEIVRSVDFQGHAGCERPRKIVEYDLPAARELTLQLSGASEAQVLVALTPVSAPP